MRIMVKRQMMRMCAIMVVLAMICSITRLPVALAYFTSDTKISEPRTLVITPLPKISGASVLFADGFIVDEDSSSEPQPMAMRSFSDGGITMQSLDQIGLNSTSQLLNEQATLNAVVILEDGFEAGEIYVPSLELHYENKSTFALSGELDQDNNLLAEFDRADIASWFDGAIGKIEQVTFDVTGEGYEEGLHQFLFDGQATIKLTGSYEVKSTEITSSAAFLIPDGNQAVNETCKLVNQDGAPLEDVVWGLEMPYQGVNINEATGEFTVQGDSAEGIVTITAVHESEGRTHQAMKTIAICQDPGLEIKGAGRITFNHGSLVTESYSLVIQNGASLDSITWEIAEEPPGVTVDQEGTVTVDGLTTAPSFTVVARATLIDIPLMAKTTVELESIAPAGVSVPEEPVVGSPGNRILINGQDFIPVPEKGATEIYTYSATDLEGSLLEEVVWSLQGKAEGVSLDGSTLTVMDTAAEGTFTLQANLELPGEEKGEVYALTGRKLITIANLAPVAVELTGPSNIIIPVVDEDVPVAEVTHQFTAVVLDQQGNMLSEEAVTWELAEDAQGVSLSEAGVLTVTSLALPGTITIITRSVNDDSIIRTLAVDLGAGNTQKPGGGGGGGTPENKDDVVKDDDDEDKGVVDDNGGSGEAGPGGDGDDVIRDDDDTDDQDGQDDTDETGGDDDATEPEEDDGGANPGDNIPDGKTGDDDTNDDNDTSGDDDSNDNSGTGNDTGGVEDSLREDRNNGEDQTGGDADGDGGTGGDTGDPSGGDSNSGEGSGGEPGDSQAGGNSGDSGDTSGDTVSS